MRSRRRVSEVCCCIWRAWFWSSYIHGNSDLFKGAWTESDVLLVWSRWLSRSEQSSIFHCGRKISSRIGFIRRLNFAKVEMLESVLRRGPYFSPRLARAIKLLLLPLLSRALHPRIALIHTKGYEYLNVAFNSRLSFLSVVIFLIATSRSILTHHRAFSNDNIHNFTSR